MSGNVRSVALIAVAAAALLAGCKESKRVIDTRTVVAGVRAAGFPKVKVLAQAGAFAEMRKLGLPIRMTRPANGPDYVFPIRAPYVWLIRLASEATAKHAAARVSPSWFLEGLGNGNPSPTIHLMPTATRVCNVVVIDWMKSIPGARSATTRIVDQLRRRCG